MEVKKGRCRVCIQVCNVDWIIDDELWDKVMNDESGTSMMKYGGCICMTCFVKLAIKMGMSPDRWKLSQDPDPDDFSWAKQVIFRYYGERQPSVWDYVKKPDISKFVVKNQEGQELMTIDDEEPTTDFTHIETIKDLPCGDHRDPIFVEPFTESYEEVKKGWDEWCDKMRTNLRAAIDEWKVKELTNGNDNR